MKGKGVPPMSEAVTRGFQKQLVEVFMNAAEHSSSKSGIFACGQYFPRMNRLDFTIADAGIGIREKVQRYFNKPEITACQAIAWAMKRGHTTTSEQPRGLGLNLLRAFVDKNGGKLQIVSGQGYYERSGSQNNFCPLDHEFPGTCVNIEVNTSDKTSYRLKSEVGSSDIC